MSDYKEKAEAVRFALQEFIDAEGFAEGLGLALGLAEATVEALIETRGEDPNIRDTTINAPGGRLITFHALDKRFDDDSTTH